MNNLEPGVVAWELDAKILYMAYGETTKFKNYQGLDMPYWDDLPDKIQQAWIAVAHRAHELYGQFEPGTNS